ncbi:MATE family efflux transporter [Bacillus timonensis]|nr:MATE family efflux transporter [Bacillus timonensis]
MKTTFTYKQKFKQFMLILIPILVTQLGLFAMNLFDTMMSGHVSANDLAGVAIGSSIWLPVFTGLSGILLAITPIISQLIGANDKEKVPFTITQGIYVATFISVIVIVLGGLSIEPILKSMSLDSNVHHIAKQYLIALSIGMVPVFVSTVLRSFFDSLGQTRISMVIILVALPVNLLLNYILIFGKLGFPKLGGVGAGYATSITYWLLAMLAIIIVRTKQPFAQFFILKNFYRVSLVAWKEIFIIGLPIGFAIFFETSIFAAVTLLMSNFNTITIASHQAALNFASLLYMIPLSISLALTIVVGFEVGAKRLNDAKQYSILGISIALLMSVISALFVFFFRQEVANLYTNDKEVLLLTQQFLIFAIFFQLSDALQAPIQGALRGFKDVNTTFVMAFVSYWIIGLPLGYYLANFTEFGAFGYWIGLIAGLAAGAIGLSFRLFQVQRKYKSIYEKS